MEIRIRRYRPLVSVTRLQRCRSLLLTSLLLNPLLHSHDEIYGGLHMHTVALDPVISAPVGCVLAHFRLGGSGDFRARAQACRSVGILVGSGKPPLIVYKGRSQHRHS